LFYFNFKNKTFYENDFNDLKPEQEDGAESAYCQILIKKYSK